MRTSINFRKVFLGTCTGAYFENFLIFLIFIKVGKKNYVLLKKNGDSEGILKKTRNYILHMQENRHSIYFNIFKTSERRIIYTFQSNLHIHS